MSMSHDLGIDTNVLPSDNRHCMQCRYSNHVDRFLSYVKSPHSFTQTMNNYYKDSWQRKETFCSQQLI